MSDKQSIRTMAFAAICQAAYLVQEVARTGQCEDEALRHALQGILVTDPETPMTSLPKPTCRMVTRPSSSSWATAAPPRMPS